MTARKSILRIHEEPRRHWVGDGFHVHGLFGYGPGAREERSPFLMMDYAAPRTFAPSMGAKPRGVGRHPHRGFETVTIAYQGEVQHHDTYGGGGVIGEGEVQWMTAGRGIEHEEYHSRAFSARGGTFEMIQLWVNLPASRKMTTPPSYQAITRDLIPSVAVGASTVRVIAGAFGEARGPAKTHTPMHVLDLRLAPESPLQLPAPAGWTVIITVLEGQVELVGAPGNGKPNPIGHAQAAVLTRAGEGVELRASGGAAKLLYLAGEPIDEPVVGYGPFVMNTMQEIEQAWHDYQSGRF